MYWVRMVFIAAIILFAVHRVFYGPWLFY
uniref:Uncharacterized protein n=1 Tax=Rhizophora mucronata TaxID=61149 RepID=A0A2P2QHD5_RHIMU